MIWSAMSFRLRRRLGAATCLGSLALFSLEGCAHVARIAPADYASLKGRGKAVISTRDGKVYEFNKVVLDSANFLGRVDIVRNVVGRDGHLDAIEDVEEVKVPFTEVESVELRSSSFLGTGVLLGAMAAGLAVLIQSFQPAPNTGGTTGGGGGKGGAQYQPHPSTGNP